MKRTRAGFLTPSIPKLILFGVALLLWVGGESQAKAFSDADPALLGGVGSAVPLWEAWVAVSAPVLWVAPRLPRLIDVPVLGAYYYFVSCVVVTGGAFLWRGLSQRGA